MGEGGPLIGALVWTALDSILSGLILWATLAWFDRCLGRVPARSEEVWDERKPAKPEPALVME
jgi:hypothetical protein